MNALNLPAVKPITQCLSCGHEFLHAICAFGDTPVADYLLKADELYDAPVLVPLDLQFCSACGLLQLSQSVDPVWMFDERYPYFSSATSSLLTHSRLHVEERIPKQGLSKNSLVVEVASNDGYLLQYFVEHGVPVLGIDPCARQAKVAREHGVNTLCEFFSLALAERIVQNNGQADTIIANNVLAHVPELNDFVAGLACLIKADGQIVIEVPYVVDMIENLEFDTIYHQHLCYFSLTALDVLFCRHGLFINDLQALSILGGSLRLNIGKQEGAHPRVQKLLEKERADGVNTVEYYEDFVQRLHTWKTGFLTMMDELKRQGARIAAYGASAKGTMLLAYCGLNQDSIDFVVDINEFKQGLYLPASNILIEPVSTLLEKQPDYTLLLVWNIADEVFAQQAEYRARGGRFIVPIPLPAIC